MARQDSSPLSALLAPAAWGYGLLARWDRARKTAHASRLPGPVVSVGNLTWGGTGKTPLLIHIAQAALARGRRPAVLTRGYGGAAAGAFAPGASLPSGASDELRLMARALPGAGFAVGPDRSARAAELAAVWRPDLYLLDDGFQHWRIKRDLDIVCVDATDPWGGGHLIPRGRLREPLAALGRAHLVLVTRAEIVEGPELGSVIDAAHRLTGAPVHAVRFEARVRSYDGEAADLRGRRVHAVCGIGNPEAFRSTLVRLGADVAGLAALRDHAAYTPGSLSRLEREAADLGAALACTAKDEVKMRSLGWSPAAPVFVVDIAPVLDAGGRAALDAAMAPFW